MTPVQLSCAENWQLTTLNSCLRSTRTRRILFFSLLDMTCNKFNAKMLVLKSSTRKISLRRCFAGFLFLARPSGFACSVCIYSHLGIYPREGCFAGFLFSGRPSGYASFVCI